MTHFAESLKNLRMKSGMTMQALADAAKVSKSMICKIEKDEVQPTIDVAARISRALGKTLSEMLHATHAAKVVLLPKSEQALWVDGNKIKRRNISPIFEGLKIEWLYVEIPAGVSFSCLPENTHKGAKNIFIVKGSLDVTVNDKTHHLKKGDSLYFSAECPHDIANPGKDVVEYYIVISHE